MGREGVSPEMITQTQAAFEGDEPCWLIVVLARAPQRFGRSAKRANKTRKKLSMLRQVLDMTSRTYQIICASNLAIKTLCLA